MKVKIHNQYKEVEYDTRRDGPFVDGISFDGHFTLWSFEYIPKTYLKESELSGDQYRKGGEMVIYRDGVSVFREFCRTPERAFVVMQYILPRLKDFMMWSEVKEGKKLYNHDVPVVIDSLCDDGEVIVKTEDGSEIPWAFKIEDKDDEWGDDWYDSDRVHILSEHLHWFRK